MTAATSTASTPWVRNTGAGAINLAGWKLDAGDRSQRFSLASYPLKKGATVRIHTGRGMTRAGHLYLGAGWPIWNNDGDTATLIDPHKSQAHPDSLVIASISCDISGSTRPQDRTHHLHRRPIRQCGSDATTH